MRSRQNSSSRLSSYPGAILQVTKEEARRRIEDIGETYKLEILDGIVERHPDAKITLYHLRGAEDPHMKPWWDLCAGDCTVFAASRATCCGMVCMVSRYPCQIGRFIIACMLAGQRLLAADHSPGFLRSI